MVLPIPLAATADQATLSSLDNLTGESQTCSSADKYPEKSGQYRLVDDIADRATSKELFATDSWKINRLTAALYTFLICLRFTSQVYVL